MSSDQASPPHCYNGSLPANSTDPSNTGGNPKIPPPADCIVYASAIIFLARGVTTDRTTKEYCSICKESDEFPSKIVGCGHTFGEDCLRRSAISRSACPECNATLFDGQSLFVNGSGERSTEIPVSLSPMLWACPLSTCTERFRDEGQMLDHVSYALGHIACMRGSNLVPGCEQNVFGSEAEYRAHLLEDGHQHPFVCPYDCCGPWDFATASGLKKHLQLTHRGKRWRNAKCDACGLTFDMTLDIRAYIEHRTQHPNCHKRQPALPSKLPDIRCMCCCPPQVFRDGRAFHAHMKARKACDYEGGSDLKDQENGDPQGKSVQHEAVLWCDKEEGAVGVKVDPEASHSHMEAASPLEKHRRTRQVLGELPLDGSLAWQFATRT